MERFRKTPRTLVIALACLVAACGGGSIKNLDQLQQASSLKIAAVEGGGQTTAPGAALEQIRFAIRDAEGKPLVNLPVDMRLIDVTGVAAFGEGGDEGAARLLLDEAWDKGETTIAADRTPSDAALPPEQLLGVIADRSKSTDGEGYVTAKIQASKRHGRAIALVARVAVSKDQNLGGGTAWAVVRTKAIASVSGDALLIVANRELQVVSGKAFLITLKIFGAGAETRYNDPAKVYRFELATEATQALAEGSTPPPATFDCAFVNGECDIPGGPFTLLTAGIVTMKLGSTSTDFPFQPVVKVLDVAPYQRFESLTLTVNDDQQAVRARPLKLRIAVDGKDAAKTYDGVDASFELTYTAEGTVGPATAAPPTKVSCKLVAGECDVPGGPFQLDVAGFVTFRLASLTPTLPFPPIQKVVRFEEETLFENLILLVNGEKEVVTGKTFEMKVAIDGKGAAAKYEGVKSDFELEFEFEKPVGAGTRLPARTFTCSFTNAECILPGGPFLFDTPGFVTARLSTRSTGARFPSLSKIFVVRAPIASSIALSGRPWNQGLERLCSTDPMNSASPCLRFNADADALDVHAVLLDQTGDPIGPANATWTILQGPLADVGRLGVAGAAAKQVVKPYRAGVGRLRVDSEEGFSFTTYYEVYPGRPALYEIRSEHDQQEIATRAFQVFVRLYDRKNNLATNYTESETLTVGLVGATASPNGTMPVANVSTQVSYIGGMTTIGTPKNVVVGGVMTRVVEGGLHATRAGEQPTLSVSGQFGTFSGDAIAVGTGPARTVQLRSATGGAGNPFIAPIVMSINDSLSMYAAGYDIYGNFTGDQLSTFAANGVLAYTMGGVTQYKLSGTSGSAVTVIPSRDNTGQVGTGRVTITPSDATIAAIESPQITVTSSAATRLAIVTEHNNTEAAGVPFKIRIHALDSQGIDAIGYEGPHTLRFVWSGANSWAGDNPVLPSGDISCTFTAGVCELAGNFLVTNAASPPVLSVEDQSGVVPGLWSAFLNAAAGTGSRLVIADKAGGPAANALPATRLVDVVTGKIERTADETLSLAAAIVDAGGNFIANAGAAVAWSGNGTPAASMAAANFSAATGTSIVFNAGKVGVGTITATLAGYTAGTTPDINIRHGALHHVRTIDTLAGTNVVSPGICFDAAITLEDADNNTVSSYTMINNLTLTWLNAASGVPVYYSPGFIVNNTRYNNTWTGSVGILGGEVNLQGIQLCLYDGTAVTPRVEVSLPAKNGFPALTSSGDASHVPADQFSIAVGAPNHIMYSSTAGGTGSFYCGIAAVQQGYVCNDFNADGGARTLYAHVNDAGGNFIRTAVGNWTTNIGAITPGWTGANGTSALTMNNQVATYGNVAWITFTPTDGTPFNGVQGFRIQPGAATHFTLVVNGGIAVKADTAWSAAVTLRDQYENIAGQNTVHTVSWNFDGTAPNSPAGNAPTIPAPAVNYDFPNGTYISPYTFRTRRGNVTSTLRASVTGFPDVSANVVVSPGTATQAVIYDLPSISGAAVGNLNLIASDQIYFYGCATDVEQNFSGCGIDGAWTATNELAGNLLPTAGSTTRLWPMMATTSTGSGVVTFTPTSGAIAPDSTGQIVVGNGPLSRFEVEKIGGTFGDVNAGVPFTLEIKATDNFGNEVKQFDGSYYLSWTTAASGQTSEGYSVSLPPSQNYNFVDGVCTDTITATLFNSAVAPRIDVTYSNGSNNYYGYSMPFSGFDVIPGTPHHYGAFIDSAGNIAQAYSDRSSTFPIRIQTRDAYGNAVCCGEANTNIVLTQTNGAAAGGTLVGTTNINMAGQTQVAVLDFAYDLGGQRKLKATSASFDTPLAASETLVFQTSRNTVANYQITPVATVTAGVGYPFQVRARDNAGNAITGADSDLGALGFAWGGPGAAPDSTAPILPGTLTFIGGVASPTVTLYKAETIAAGSWSITDDQPTPRTGSATGGVVVQPGPLTNYHITASHASRTADTSGLFDVTIRAYDAYLNPRPGDGSLSLVPVRVSGATNVGTFGGAASTSLNLGAGVLNVTGLHYNVPHVISFGLSGTSATVSSSDQITFTPTIHTVKGYGLTHAASVTAGAGNLAVTARALDGGNNTIVSAAVDTALNAQSYCWSGAGTSPTPASVAPTYGTAPSFSNGVSVFTHGLRRAETLAINALVLQDNYMGSCTATRQGRNASAITIAPAGAVSYDLVAIDGLAQTAGVGFDMQVRALDSFSNVDTNWTSDDLTFSWSGTTATPATPNNAGGITAAVFNVGGNETFTAGLFTTATNPFILYRKTDASPVLSVSGGSIAGPYTRSGFTTTNAATVNFVKILDVATAQSAHTAEIGTHTMTTDQTKQLWAHGYDTWANWVALRSVTWSGTGVLGPTEVPAGPATNVTVSPTLIGTGTVVADDPSTDDATGTFTIDPGVITKAVFLTTPPLTQSSVTCGAIDLQTRDAENNPSPVTGNTTFNLTSTAGTGTFHSNATCTASITTTTLTTGQHTKTIYYIDTLTGAKTLTAAESPSAPWTDATLATTIVPGPISKVVFTTAALNQTANVCGTLSFVVQDVNGNVATLSGATDFSLASTFGSGSYYGTAGCGASAITQVNVASGQSGTTVYYRDTAVGLPSLTIDETPGAGWTAATQAQTINPGSFTINGPSSPTNANPPTVTWTASAGGPNYQLKVDDVASCASPQQTHASVSGTSQFLSAIPDGNYYVCVTALGNGAANVAATNSGAYQFQVDVTPPSTVTGLITAADANNGADVRYDDDTSVFFRWSAATDALSGLQHYVVHHYAQAACGGTVTTTSSTTNLYYQLTGAAHGTTRSFKVEAFDLAGNSSLSACSPNILIDTVAPSTATALITAADSAGGADVRYDNDTQIFFVWTAGSDATSAVRDYTVNVYAQAACGGTATPATGITGTSYTLNGAANNTAHSFTVTTFDMAGNSVVSSCSGDLFVDTTAPVAASSLITPADSAGGASAAYDDDTTIFFKWTAATDTGGSGIASYTLHRYAQASCGGASIDTTGLTPATLDQSFASGVDGTTYSFKITAYDNATNSTLSACSSSIKVDTSAPTTPATALVTAADAAGGADVRYDDDTTIYFKWTAAVDNAGGSGIATYTVQRYAQASCGGASIDTAGVVATNLQFTGGVHGTTYSFKVVAYDNAGNASAVSACSGDLLIDTLVPVAASSLITPADSAGGASANYDNDTGIFFAWTLGSDAHSGVASQTLHRYSQANCGGTSTDTPGLSAATTSQSYTGTHATTYSFKITVIDNAGNATTSACSSNMLIDTAAPNAATALITPADSAAGASASYDDDTTIYFKWTAGSDPVSGLASYTLHRYDQASCAGGSTDTTSIATGTLDQSFASAVDGTTYSFKITAYDNAGNSTQSACSSNIKVDTSAPTTTASALVTAADSAAGADTRYDNDTTVYFKWTAAVDNAGGSGIANYTVHRYTQAACGGSASNVTSVTATDYAYATAGEGTYSFKVTAYDNAGNAGAISSCSGDILIDTTAPVAASGLITAADSAGGADVRYDDDTTVYFVWSAGTDAGSGIASYTLHRYAQASCGGGSTDTPGLSAATLSQSFTGTHGTTYSFKVTAYDNAGNSTLSACSGNILPDTVNPTAASALVTAADSAGGADVRYDDDTTVFFKWTAGSDAASGVASYTLHRYDQAACGGGATDTSGLGAGVTSQSYTGTHGTTYSFKVTVFDNAGRSTQSVCSGDILIDTLAPVAASSLITPADSAGGASANYDNDTGIFFAWTLGSDAHSGVASQTLHRYSQANCGGTSADTPGLSAATTSQSYTGTHATTYSFKITVIDNAGNSTQSACSSNMLIDTGAPTAASALITPADSAGGASASYDDDTTIYFKWTAGSDAVSGLASYTLHRYAQANCGGGSTDSAGIATSTLDQSFASAVDGTTYSFKITAYDNAGNSTQSACSSNIMVDTSAPTTAASALVTAADSAGGADTRYDDDTTVYFKWTAAADNAGGSGIANYTVQRYAQASCGGGSTDTSGVSATNLQFTGGVHGTTYSFKVVAYDNAGNAGAASACSGDILIDTLAPVAASSLITPADSAGGASANYDDDTGIFFAWTLGSDAHSGVASQTLQRYSQANCGGTSIDTSGLSAVTTSQSFTGAHATTYSFKIIVIDNAGNATTSACSSNMLIDTGAPTAASALITPADSAGGASASYDDDTTIYFKWTAGSDAVSGLASYSLHRYDQANCGGGATDTTGISTATLNQSFTSAVDGTTYSFKISAIDNAGNTTLSACSSNIMVDTSVPTTAASALVTAADSAAGADVRYDDDTTVYFKWTAAADNAGGSGIANYTVHRYTQAACGGSASNVTGVTATDYTYATGGQGTYSFKVTAYDNAGNAGTISACSGDIMVDTTAPGAASGLITAADSAGGADVRYDDDTTVYFVWSAGTDAGSGIASYTLHRYAQASCGGGSTDTPGLSAATLSQSYTGTHGTTYSFKVTAYDNAGNSTLSSCSGNITPDTTDPTAASALVTAADSAGGADVRYDDDTTVYFKWTAGSDAHSGVASYTLHRYDQASCGGSATNTAGLGAGVTSQSYTGTHGTTYSFKVTIFDNAGRSTQSICSGDILIDTAAPTAASSLITPADSAGGASASYDNDTGIFFAWTLGSDAHSGVASQTLHRFGLANCGGGSTDTPGLSAATTSQSFTGSSGSTYSFKITVIDNAGNATLSACSSNMLIDTGAPTAASALITPADSAGGASASYDDDTTIYFKWTAGSDAVSGLASYTLHRFDQANCGGGSTDTTGIATGTLDQSFASAVDGTTYSFKITAVDNAGNTTLSSCSSNIVVDTSAPTTAASALITAADSAGGADVRYDDDTTVFFKWTAAADNAGGSGIANYTVHRYAQAACGGSASNVTGVTATDYSYATGAEGTYSFKITAYDNAGNAGSISSCSGNITIDTTAPGAASALVTAADSAAGADVRYDDDTGIYFAWTAPTETGSGIATYTLHRYALANCGGTVADTVGIAAGTTSQSFTGAHGTTYSFKITTYDNAGLSSLSSCSGNLLIDTADPTAASGLITAADSAAGADVRYDDDTTIYFKWTAGSDAHSGVASYTLHRYDQASCGGASTDTAGLGAGVTSQSFASAVDGTTYSFKVSIFDAAGRSSLSACSGDILVDTSAPSPFAISAPTASATIFDNTPTATWSDPGDADHFIVHLDDDAGCGSPSQSDANVATTSKTFTALEDGVWYLCVTAVDAAGNTTAATNTDLTFTVSTGAWTAMTSGSAPDARRDATAVWASGHGLMLVWGGYDGSSNHATGGRYDPALDQWTAIETTDAPSARRGHTAVWTGSEMIVWGGYDGASTYHQSGAVYAVGADTWTATDVADTEKPTVRRGHVAVWDTLNSKMLVFGGTDGSTYASDGAAYDPAGPDYWTALPSEADRPSGRSLATAVWTGSKMIVWGGYDGAAVGTGAVYDPACPGADCWTEMSTTDAPSARYRHTAVWTGSKMLVFGGFDGTSYLAGGAAYDPSNDTWTPFTGGGAPSARSGHVAVWDNHGANAHLVVWGGQSPAVRGDGAAYSLALGGWSVPSLRATDAPSARVGAAAVWTGTAMLVWGGYDGIAYLATGARFAPP